MFKKTALFSGDGFPYFLRTFSVLCCTFFVFFHHFSRTFFLFSHILCKIFLKKSNVQFFLLARAIHSEHFLLHCLKKEIATAEELDLRQVGKVLIFRDTQNLPIIYRSLVSFVLLVSLVLFDWLNIWKTVNHWLTDSLKSRDAQRI